ncbi:helix-turn-helix domain-containing protein [Nocardiopsis potens]|uniref:helix-turn-helix domain-containing protein n=1 Tax=Nocardiopsis potens TaxID=1246458 RepID=UPI000476D112|nr:helix-turn-helix transcriptional regulator [Nocardiopsis potens]
MRDMRSPSLRLRRLASELRRSREAAGYKVTQVAKELGWSAPKVSKMETTETKRINPNDLDRLLDLYEVKDPPTREAMQALARDARERGWWARYKEIFGDRALPDFEAEAKAVKTFEALAIPGLLQTPEYAEAVFRGGRFVSQEQIDRRVAFRMARREILSKFDPTHLRVVLDEAALRRLVGGREVMLTQVKHLFHMAQMPNIDLQVIPLAQGAHAALTAPFSILEFPDPLDTPIVFVETATNGLFLEEADDVARYNVIFSDIQGAAMSATQSADFIAGVIKELEKR